MSTLRNKQPATSSYHLPQKALPVTESADTLIPVSHNLDEVSKALERLNGGPHASDLDYLKSLDDIVQGSGGFSVKKADAIKVIQDHVMAALPKDTAEVLKVSNGGSLALELLRRDLTEFDVLAQALYSSSEEERQVDEGLRRLYVSLSPATELHGALLSAGIDVGAKKWAQLLTARAPNLRRLRSTPWHQVALLLKLVVKGSESGGDDTRVFDGPVRVPCTK